MVSGRGNRPRDLTIRSKSILAFVSASGWNERDQVLRTRFSSLVVNGVTSLKLKLTFRLSLELLFIFSRLEQISSNISNIAWALRAASAAISGSHRDQTHGLYREKSIPDTTCNVLQIPANAHHTRFLPKRRLWKCQSKPILHLEVENNLTSLERAVG